MSAAKQATSSRNLLEYSSNRFVQTQGASLRSELLAGSTLFPSQLHQLGDVPKKLYALGSVAALKHPAIAIVGARKATPYGLECAKRFARVAASQGIAVISGGAIGCDMAAHQGALDVNGTTIVVLGSGADVVYPLRARSLFEEVLEAGGLLLSEAPWGSAPISWAFSKRNRIIAALARATLIVEAGLPSGTFQTADHTLALGNEVLVVPGPIFSKESKGSNHLLVQGAHPVVDDESFKDVLAQIFGTAEPRQQQLRWEESESQDNAAEPAERPCGAGKSIESTFCASSERAQEKPQELRERRLKERLLAALTASPMTIDALAETHRVSVMEIVRYLSKLEIRGEVTRLRDGRYAIKPRDKPDFDFKTNKSEEAG